MSKSTDDPVIAALLASMRRRGTVPSTVIHPHDDMYNFELRVKPNELSACIWYFRSGMLALDAVGQVVRWRFGGFGKVESFLDFAGGHGRVGRFLVQEIPPDRVWTSDILPDAVRFQERQFGVHGLVSTVAPEEFQVPRLFDCIQVISLFSHLPRTTFVPWLRRLYDLLAPDGLLVFSTHDLSLAPQGAAVQDGFTYAAVSESERLDTQDYGSTYVSEEFVRRSLLEATGQDTYLRIPRAVAHHQDLYVVSREPRQTFEGFVFSYPPVGNLDQVTRIDAETLHLAGWAADPLGLQPISEVQIWVGDSVVQRVSAGLERPDVAAFFGLESEATVVRSGWEGSIALERRWLDQGTGLIVKAVTDGGAADVIYAGRLTGEGNIVNAAVPPAASASGDPLSPSLRRPALTRRALKAASRYWGRPRE